MSAITEEVITFWFGPRESPGFGKFRKEWFGADAAFDFEIREKFFDLYQEAKAGHWDRLKNSPEGVLALILLFDQFSRNMFRGTKEMYGTDSKAVRLAHFAVEKGLDQQLEHPSMRQFIYMPFEHSENLEEQELSVRLFEKLGNENLLDWAVRHEKTVRRFGRFPSRNDVLERTSTKEEVAYLEQNPLGF